MSWLQAETVAGQTDPQAIEEALTELGAVAVWLRDAGNEPVLEPAPGETPGWSETLVTALFPDELVADELANCLKGLLPDVELSFCTIEDKNWQAEWQSTLQSMQFGKRLWVVPHDAQQPDAAAVVRLEPGMAFGTGEHPTTAMCLNWLATQDLTEKSVLDYGCGSGLLAIAAVALGSAECGAVDIDPQALDATLSNAQNNSCAEQILIAEPDALPTDKQYDVLVANILSGILIQLGPVLREQLKPGAALALTGILAHQADEVCSAWSDWADLTIGDQDGDWVLLNGNKRG
jgi:ribosomal protein L11 methyltransferase